MAKYCAKNTFTCLKYILEEFRSSFFKNLTRLTDVNIKLLFLLGLNFYFHKNSMTHLIGQVFHPASDTMEAQISQILFEQKSQKAVIF